MQTSDNSVEISDLEANTTYDIRIKADCGSLESSYKRLSFTTPCIDIVTLPQTWDFETNNTAGTTSYPLPSCWQRPQGISFPYVYNSSYCAYNGNNSLYFYNNGDIAVLAPIDTDVLPLNTLQLSFYAKQGYGDAILEVVVMNDPMDTTTFQSVATIPLSENYDVYDVTFDTYTGTGSYIALKNNSSVLYRAFYVDDVTLDVISSCSRPKQLTSQTTSNTAIINWTSTGNDFEIYYKEESSTGEYMVSDIFEPTEEDNVYTCTLINLNPATNYVYYIEAICDNGIESIKKSFKTECASLDSIPQSWDFETYEEDNNLPACWSRIIPNDIYVSMGASFLGNRSLYLSGTNIAILPQMDWNELTLNELQLRFQARSSWGDATLQVGIISDINDVSSFVSVATFTTNNTFEEKIAMFSAYEGQGTYIAIKPVSGAVYVDDVILEIIPDCPPVQNISAVSVLPISISLTWLGNNESYLVRYKAEGETQWSTDNITSSGASAIISGLSANTNYIVSVAPDCEETTDSTYRTATFTTSCSAVSVPYIVDFEDETLLNCWNIASQSKYYYYSYTYYPKLSSAESYAYSPSHSWIIGGDNSGVMVVVVPKVNLNIEQTRFQFYIRKATENSSGKVYGNVEIGLMTIPTDTTTFISLDTILETDITTSYSLQTVDFNQFIQYTGQNYHIAIKYLGTGATYLYNSREFHIDNIKIDNIPSCLEPQNVVVSNTTSNSVDISWTEEEADFKVYYKPISDGEDVEYSSVETNLTNGVYTLENLQPATTYKFYIATVCSDSTETSTQTYTFTTSCVVLDVPYTTSFEDIVTNSRPLCWSFINSQSLTYSSYTVYPCVSDYTYRGHLSSKGLEFHSTTDTNTAAIAVMPAFATDLNYLSVEFWTKPESDVSTGNNTSGRLDVGYVIDPTDASTFVLVDSISVYDLEDSAYHRYRVSFDQVELDENKMGYIAFRHVSNSSYSYWYLDDVKVENISECYNPISLTSDNATINTIDLYWNTGVTNVNLYYKTSSAMEFDSIENIYLNEEGIYILEDLQPSTVYNWKVGFVCSYDNEFYISETKTFITSCMAIDTLPYTEDFEQLSETDLGCWTNENISGSTSWTIKTSSVGKVAYRSYTTGAKSRLISPIFDITSLSQPKLSYNWEVCSSGNNLDSLYVYYRTNVGNEWVLLTSHGSSYSGNNTSYTASQFDSIMLPDASETYQIAFLAVGHNGYGVYLDNVVVSDDDGSVVTPVEPTVATNVATNIAQTSVTLNGAITDAGNQTITAKGFEWKATNNGTYTQVLSSDAGNTFTYNLTNLTANTSYTYRAFATTANGPVYGTEQVFTTLEAGEEPCTPLTASITETLCYGETFTFNGQTYNATGTYTTTVAGQNGDCDTNYTINLTILPQNAPINEEVTISQSELPYEYHGQTYNDFGTYSVTLQDENGCDQVYNLTLVHNSGIAEVEEELTISLYPNPTDNNATLRVKGLNEQATIIITDQQGRVVQTKVLPQGTETFEVESERLASGVYYIRIQTTNTIRTEKLIKK